MARCGSTASRRSRAPRRALRAQLGFGPDGSDPSGNAAWTWVDGAFNGDAGNNDEYKASMLPESTGSFDYAWRYSTTGGRDWVYADLDGSPNGYSPAQAGSLTVNASGDSTRARDADGLDGHRARRSGIELAWDAVVGDATCTGTSLSDRRRRRPVGAARPPRRHVLHRHGGRRGRDWHYRVLAVDQSFNRSAPSAPWPGPRRRGRSRSCST
jgi:hypothetical protein